MDLAAVIASRATGETRLASGVVTDNLKVSVGGGVVSALWADNITVEPGDRVLVGFSREYGEQSTALVLCRLSDAPRPAFGTVVEAISSSPTVKVDAGGVEVDAHRLNDYLPTTGATVALLWQGSTPIMLGKRTIIKPDTDAGAGGASTPSISAPSTSSKPVHVTASDSATWDGRRGSFSSYMSKTVGQGSYGGWGPLTGAWYYGNAGKALAGRSKKLEIYVPARRPGMGYNNANLTLVFSLHGQKSRSGKPATTGGTHSYSISPSWSGGWVSLPAAWIPSLAKGYGIALVGSGYGAVGGKPLTGQSGQLRAS